MSGVAENIEESALGKVHVTVISSFKTQGY